MLRSSIIRETRAANKARDGGDLQETTTNSRRIHLPEELDRLPRHVRRAPEVRLEHPAHRALLVRVRLDLAHDRNRGVVHDDVKAAERLLDFRERRGDFGGLAHVELEDEEAVCRVFRLQVVEGGRAPCGGDNDLALLKDELGESAPEAGGRPGN